MNNKEKFIELMTYDIFGLDKELNFGVYKVFKQSKSLIEELLKDIANVDEKFRNDIYNYLYNFFSLYYESGDFGYTKRAFATFTIPYSYKEFDINDKKKHYEESSHNFFYEGEETKFTWRTEDSYYIKSNKYFDNVEIKINDIKIKFKVIDIEDNFDRSKTRLFKLKKIKKENNILTVYFVISNEQTSKSEIYEKIAKELKEKSFKKYLYKDGKFIFKDKKLKEENKIQIHSLKDLYLTKKAYLEKLYGKKKEFEDKKKIEKRFKEDKLLNFFYKLDRGFNSFLVGIDSDYFIHKNLKRFLLVEMDKFIKNYILSDTELLLENNEKSNKLRQKAKIFKEKATKFIEFLSAVEEFQKYIWEKKKIITKTEFIVSSNKINDVNILNEVLKNKKQIDEWINLGLCKNIPNLIELQSYPYPIDTNNFNEGFKYKILSQFDDLEKEIDGILIKSENFQALKFLESKFKEKIKCIYIDPPYNTGNDGFVYKDNYQEASWLSMMNDRLRLAKELMKDDGVIFTQIDENESAHLKILSNIIFGKGNHATTIHVQMSSVQGQKVGAAKEGNIVKNAEYIFSYVRNGKKNIAKNLLYEPTEYDTHYNKYLIPSEDGSYIEKNLTEIINQNEELKNHLENILNKTKFTNKDIAVAYQISQKFRDWIHKNKENIARDDNTSGLNIPEEIKNQLEEGKIIKYYASSREYLLTINSKGTIRQRILLKDKIKQCHDFNNTYGVSTIRGDWWAGFYKDMGNVSKEDNVTFANGKKASRLIEQLIYMVTDKEKKEWVLDFFAGSGTTPAVAYKMNKKFIGIEMNDYFDDLMLKRMKYTIFGNSGGIKSKKESGLIQYIYLEQYENIIENIKLSVNEKDFKKPEISMEEIFNPLKNEINKFEIKPTLEMLFSFIYHKGLNLKSIKKEDNLLIGECMEGAVILGENKNLEYLKEKNYNYQKIYTNLKPKNNINPDIYKYEIICEDDFKGI